MNQGPLVFLGVFAAVIASWLGLVIVPHLQFGQQDMVVLEETGESYPGGRSGLALQGAEVYREQGCYYCHTQQVRPAGEGPDLKRRWGVRRTVARDYLRDQPVLLGQMRLGPDLANLGARETNRTTLLLKLYNARVLIPNSLMPRYPYLFETRKLPPGATPSGDALPLVGPFAPPPGFEVVPGPDALALVAYLESLRAEARFYEVFPTPPPKADTNQVQDALSPTNGPPTNAVPATNATVTP